MGAMIFSQPDMRRSPFELALLGPNSSYVHPQARQEAPAWARRSRFLVHERPIMVSEVFLEEFRVPDR